MYSLKPLKRINTNARLSIKIEVKRVDLEMTLEFRDVFNGRLSSSDSTAGTGRPQNENTHTPFNGYFAGEPRKAGCPQFTSSRHFKAKLMWMTVTDFIRTGCALTLLVGRQEGHPARKKWGMVEVSTG